MDNCSTNDSLVTSLPNKLDCSSLILHGKLFHMRHCAHILNLISPNDLCVHGDDIEKVRNIVAFWTTTPKREKSFKEVARHIKVYITKKIIIDCKTR